MLNIEHTNVQIMWKEIVLIFLFIYIIRFFTDIYIIIVYKNIYNRFYAHDWFGLEKKVKKHQNLCSVFLSGPFNKKIRLIYNGLCMILSSIALIDENDCVFITEIDNIKKDEEFELKPFVLALYYRSKNDLTTAMKFYHKYSRCIHQDENIDIIMNYLFSNQECKKMNNEIAIAIKSFQNPAIIKLFEDNNLIIKR
ncbi:MAG: hypothetical protein U0L59_01800 [Faecalimonas sp.]|nr:hypothetical protein [Faecalimonas sp.]